MYVLKAQAHTHSTGELRRHVGTWKAALEEAATGWLGNTTAIDADRDVVMLMRFASEEAAFITCDLPEWERWWLAFGELCESEPTFTGSDHVVGIGGGVPDEASEVRITQGVADREQVGDLWAQFESLPLDDRTGLAGGFVAWTDDEITEALYFTAASFSPMVTELLDKRLALITENRATDVGDPILVHPAAPTPDAPNVEGAPA